MIIQKLRQCLHRRGVVQSAETRGSETAHARIRIAAGGMQEIGRLRAGARAQSADRLATDDLPLIAEGLGERIDVKGRGSFYIGLCVVWQGGWELRDA